MSVLLSQAHTQPNQLTNQEQPAANRFMRTTHARELSNGWDVHHGEKSGRMTNYYAQVCHGGCDNVFIQFRFPHTSLSPDPQSLSLHPCFLFLFCVFILCMQCKVCRSCFLVYRTLDKAREAVSVRSDSLRSRPPSQFRSRQDLSKSVPTSYKQQLEEKKQKELLKVTMEIGRAYGE